MRLYLFCERIAYPAKKCNEILSQYELYMIKLGKVGSECSSRISMIAKDGQSSAFTGRFNWSILLSAKQGVETILHPVMRAETFCLSQA